MNYGKQITHIEYYLWGTSYLYATINSLDKHII